MKRKIACSNNLRKAESSLLHRDLIKSFNEEIGMIDNPLINTEWNTDNNAAELNKRYLKRKAAATQYKAEHQWSKYLFLHHRSYRFRVFNSIKNHLSDREYWNLLRDVWVDHEFLCDKKYLIKKLLTSNRPGRKNIMKHQELKAFNRLSDNFLIYRGYEKGRGLGWSWTLNMDKAIWFASRWYQSDRNDSKPRILMSKANKKDVIAYFLSRNEDEIVIDPHKVNIIGKIYLDPT